MVSGVVDSSLRFLGSIQSGPCNLEAFLPFPLPKPQNERDLAFSRRSLAAAEAAAAASTGPSFPPNLNPEGMGAPLSGPEILTFPPPSNLSGECTTSKGEADVGEEDTVFKVGWNALRSL